MITHQKGSTGRPELTTHFDFLLSLSTFLKTNMEEKNIFTEKKAYRKFPVKRKQREEYFY